MDRPTDNLIARLEQNLRDSRALRLHLTAKLRALEAEAETVRSELAEADNLASETQAAIYRLLSSVLAGNQPTDYTSSSHLPSDVELEAAMRRAAYQQPGAGQAESRYRYPAPEPRYQPPPVEADVNRLSSPGACRFPSFAVMLNPSAIALWIAPSRAVTMLLREEGAPLHVEIYNRLLEGGFKFTGANPTISIAVSLNRNTRFAIAPGTFDLRSSDASKAS